jgi:putative tryptophan/tyrosine transport system substrate-binding protein
MPFDRLRRREFVTLLGGAAAMWPLAARAQQRPIPVVGHLSNAADGNTSRMEAFRNGLGMSGYVEGKNVSIEYRFANGQPDLLSSLAVDLVRRGVAVISTAGIPAARAAKGATSTTPIVFTFGEDPVTEGIVASLSRPGGNATGFTYFTNQLIAKRLGLLDQIVPKAEAFAFLTDAGQPPSGPDIAEARIAAGALRRRLEVLTVENDRDLEAAFAMLAEKKIGAVAVDVLPFFLDHRETVIALAASHRIPAIYDRRDFPKSGALMSYGAPEEDARRQAGIYVGRILKGEKPGDLPVQQSAKFEFVINLKTAKALGLNIAQDLLSIADEVIE